MDVVGAIHRLKIHRRVTSELVDQALDLAGPKWRFIVERFGGRAKRYPPVDSNMAGAQEIWLSGRYALTANNRSCTPTGTGCQLVGNGTL
jgi:hypothetical protein